MGSHVKQVLVVRTDLQMNYGKTGSQCGHGATKGFFDRGYFVETPESSTPYELRIPCTPPMYEWVKGIFTKIVVAVSSEEELIDLKKKADEMKILNALIEDNGLTCFNGKTTRTVLAIGPDDSDKIDLLTGKLPLLK